MNAMRKITVEIPEAIAARMDAEVAAGHYADTGELVTERVSARFEYSGSKALDPTLERWLVEEVGPTYDAYKADPNRLLTEDQAFEMLDALVARRSPEA